MLTSNIVQVPLKCSFQKSNSINLSNRSSFVRSMVTGFCTSLKVKRPCRRVPRDQLLLLSPRTPKLYTILISIINMKQQTPGVLKLSLPGMQQTQEDWVGRHLHAEVNSCGTNVPSGMRFLLNTALLHL